MQGIGSTQLTGFSKSINLSSFIPKSNKDLKMLLIGSNDPRNILHTLYATTQKIDFYILEPITNVARFLLLLDIVFDTSIEKPQELFLEIFGNTLIRSKTKDYITQKSKHLIHTISDSKSIFDFTKLKYRERDDLEFVFQFWASEKPFDISLLWDLRIRQLLKQRYDTRSNIYDWDYNMKLVKNDELVISKQEYLKWRETGIGFTIRDSTFDFVNRTIATVDNLLQVFYIDKDGVKVPKWGLFSDILVGPYISFGIDSENKELLEKKNDVFVFDAQQVSMENVKRMISSLRGGCTDDSVLKGAASEKDNVVEKDKDNEKDVMYMNETLNRFKIKVLSPDPSRTFQKPEKLPQFDLVFIGCTMVHRIPDTLKLSKSGGRIVIESCRFLLELTNEQCLMFNEKVGEMCKELKLISKDDDFVCFEKL